MSPEPRIPIASDGWPMLSATFGLAAGFFLLAKLDPIGLGWVSCILAVVFAVLGLFLVNFFRDPRREPPPGVDSLISPADGKILSIDRDLQEDRFLHRPTTRICIFMSPLNVHVNRAPVDGEVTQVSYNPGKYFAAFSEKASLDNEQNAIMMRDRSGRDVLFIQIAGFLARRIVCKVRPGMTLDKGERVGMIKLGSRVDVYVPGPIEVKVSPGEVVRAGESILGVLS